MQNVSNKTDGASTLPAAEFNSHKNELQDFVAESGQTLALATADQLRKAVSIFARGLYCADSSGTPNVLTLARPTAFTDVPAYYDGMTIAFDTINANTGATTATFNGLASKKVRTSADTDLVGGEILANIAYTLVYKSSFDSAAGAFVLKPSYSIPTGLSPAGVRQTVQAASVDANGYANFISIGTLLAVNIAAASVNIKIHATGGNVSLDRIGTISADTSIAGLTGSSTNYLFAEVALNGTVTLGKTVLKPVYQQGGIPSITLNQYTFNISEMKMYVGNGATATQVYGVFIGHAVTNTTNVTSVVNYALNGEFITPTSALLVAATITTLNHNLGMKGICIPILTCLTGQAGYTAGDELPFYIVNSAGAYSSAWSYNEYTASYATIAATLYLVHLGSAAFTAITPANFNVKFKVTRGW